MIKKALEQLTKWAPIIELLFASGFDPEEAMDELRAWEVLKRKQRDQRMGRESE